jgi:hypothetical protein
MTAAGICILFVVLTIVSTFSHLFFGLPGPGVTMIMFILALVCLMTLTIGFIYDFLSSLKAVELEIKNGIEHEKILNIHCFEPQPVFKQFELSAYLDPNAF